MKVTMFHMAVACAAMLTPMNLTAQDTEATQVALVDGSGADERINQAKRLRMLSQRVAAEACYVAGDIDGDYARETLANANDEIDQILAALENGDPRLGIIGAEERPRTIDALAKFRAAWMPMEDATAAVLDGDASKLDVAYQNALAVLDATEGVYGEIIKQYVNPAEVVQADQFLLDLAGRQQVLLKAVSREACMAEVGHTPAESIAALDEAMKSFLTTAEALRHGMPALGVRPPPTPEIADALDAVQARWMAAAPALQAVVSGNHADRDALALVHKELIRAATMMDQVVDMYQEASQQAL